MSRIAFARLIDLGGGPFRTQEPLGRRSDPSLGSGFLNGSFGARKSRPEELVRSCALIADPSSVARVPRWSRARTGLSPNRTVSTSREP
jgi:hypothetical protein